MPPAISGIGQLYHRLYAARRYEDLASIRGSVAVIGSPLEVDHGVGGGQVGAAGLPSFSTVSGSWSGRGRRWSWVRRWWVVRWRTRQSTALSTGRPRASARAGAAPGGVAGGRSGRGR